jgi:hypothetical protein
MSSKSKISLFKRLITAKKSVNIDYYMVFFISYPLSALGHDINPRADRLKG